MNVFFSFFLVQYKQGCFFVIIYILSLILRLMSSPVLVSALLGHYLDPKFSARFRISASFIDVIKWCIYICICRESCTAVQDLLCYVQWPVIQSSNIHVKLPSCDSTLPSKWDMEAEGEPCTDAKLFEKDDSEVTCKFALFLAQLLEE